jgi:hypothetical protein
VDAWIGLTFIDICLAVGSCPSRSAFARVLVRSVNAFSVVQTWQRFALIDVDIAVDAGESRWTYADVVSRVVVTHSGNAWIGKAFVDFTFAAVSCVTKFATAFVFVVQLFAFTVRARVRSTLGQHLVALHADVSRVTEAFECIQFVHASSKYTWI